MLKKILCAVLAVTTILSAANFQMVSAVEKQTVVISEDELINKTLGGFIGKFAGVTWGGPTEAKAMGRLLTEAEIPNWDKPSRVNNAFDDDDLYVMIPLLDTLYKNGLDCDINLLADSYKNSGFYLWHANAAARENLQHGIPYPYSGHYKYNIHNDCLDWQITTDFVGQAYPGLVNGAIKSSFDIGHIMSYGDGTYGGVFISAMHSKAYTAKSVDEIIEAGVNSVPKGSKFRKIVDEVMQYYSEGKTWQENWELINNKYLHTDRCTVSEDLNIDASFNSAFILIGLLYGEGDFEQSMKIAMMCGQDSDCNPSSVGGILGNFYGEAGLPDKWKSEVDYSRKFQSTDYTLNDAVKANVELAKEAILAAGGSVDENKNWTIPVDDTIVPPALEQTPNGPVIEMRPLLNNYRTVTFQANARGYAKIKSYEWDFGDGTYGTGDGAKHKYAKPGTYHVSVTVENIRDEVMNQDMTIEVNDNVAKYGTPICSVKDPAGWGNHDLNIIKDGSYYHLFRNEQFDTYLGYGNGKNTYFGYEFGRKYLINKLIFTEGMHLADGGWFKNGLNVEYYDGAEWKKIDLLPTSTPYKNADTLLGHGAPFEKYVFEFEPVEALKIRIIGDAGGSAAYASIAELQVIQYIKPAPAPQLPYKANENIASSEINGDIITAVPKDGAEKIEFEFNPDVKAYVDPARTIEVKNPVQLKELITKLYIVQGGKNKVIEIKKPFSVTYDFRDVPTDEWYSEYVDGGKENGVVLGNKEGDGYYFYPENNATRIESLVMILRAFGIESTQFHDKELSFADYDDSMFIYSWSNDYVKAALNLNILNGSADDGKLYLYGEQPITRKEFFTFLSRILKKVITVDEKYKDFDLSIYEDKEKIESTDWFVDEAKFLSYYKIVEGSYNYLKPDDNITRSEIIKSLMCALEICNK